jgi:polyisoprenyl-teichoic acid--peptidoglycan teichoic acid transferase
MRRMIMEHNSRRTYRVKKKKKRKKIGFFFLFLLVLASCFAAYIFYQTIQAANKSYSELERGAKSKLRDEIVELDKHPISILLMGVENYATKGEAGRADSIIVATFNPNEKTMKLLSIPRDTRTYLPSKDREDKINHSFNDGKEATIDAVEHLLDIPIDYYAMVNFKGFKAIIDEIGGVEVNVPFDFSEETDTKPKRILHFKKGRHKLNGEEALAYARMRKQDPRGDFGRNDRQKEIIIAAIDSMLKPSNILKIDDVAEHIGDNVETNIKVNEGIAFATKYRGFGSKNITSLYLEGSDDRINGVYYFIPSEESLEKVKTELKEHLEITSEN